MLDLVALIITILGYVWLLIAFVLIIVLTRVIKEHRKQLNCLIQKNKEEIIIPKLEHNETGKITIFSDRSTMEPKSMEPKRLSIAFSFIDYQCNNNKRTLSKGFNVDKKSNHSHDSYECGEQGIFETPHKKSIIEI